MPQPTSKIGIFDSGLGGLSVLKAFQAINPGYSVIYFADQYHVPYGPRTIDQIRNFSFRISEFLIDLGAEVIVVACNTASAASLHELRKMIPEKKFVGMEPAVKPAAERTNSGKVGVLATPATFQGKLYASVVERFAKDVKIYQDTCPGLVQEIEKGNLSGEETLTILNRAILPMLEQGIDTLVMGCTHYPFVIPAIKKIVGEEIRIIDPAPAVARQTLKITKNEFLPSNSSQSDIKLITSGSKILMENTIQSFGLTYSSIQQVKWSEQEDKINITQL